MIRIIWVPPPKSRNGEYSKVIMTIRAHFVGLPGELGLKTTILLATNISGPPTKVQNKNKKPMPINNLIQQACRFSPESSHQTLVKHQYLDPNGYHLWRIVFENVSGRNLKPGFCFFWVTGVLELPPSPPQTRQPFATETVPPWRCVRNLRCVWQLWRSTALETSPWIMTGQPGPTPPHLEDHPS